MVRILPISAYLRSGRLEGVRKRTSFEKIGKLPGDELSKISSYHDKVM
jgi:hypothetical protein